MKTLLLTILTTLITTQSAFAETYCSVQMKQADGSYVSTKESTKKLNPKEPLQLIYQENGFYYVTQVNATGKQLVMFVMTEKNEILFQVFASDYSNLEMISELIPSQEKNFICFQAK